MDDSFTWGGFKPVVILLLVLSLPAVDRMAFVIPRMGGVAFLLVAGVLLVIFAVPFSSLQVIHTRQYR